MGVGLGPADTGRAGTTRGAELVVCCRGSSLFLLTSSRADCAAATSTTAGSTVRVPSPVGAVRRQVAVAAGVLFCATRRCCAAAERAQQPGQMDISLPSLGTPLLVFRTIM